MMIKTWLEYATNTLVKYNIDNPQLEAVIILSSIFKKPKYWIYAFNEYILNKFYLNKINQCLNRRIKKEPLAYIVGFCEFWSLNIYVTPDVLIPRKETELIVEVSINKIYHNNINKILELGTGSGAISFAIASSNKFVNIMATDISEKAIQLAQYNLKQLNFTNIILSQSNWFNKIAHQTFDIIISNPPYISKQEYKYHEEYLKFEPKIALIAKNNGLNNFKHIISHSYNYLNNFGWLILEHAPYQATYIMHLFKKKFYNIQTYMDLNNKLRVMCAQKILHKNNNFI
ncbi:peptide chain release factor N(5)-glutamine methyltransferase [Enterobacteriaceae endosymbiont of Macroplea appendiculata]|uniref:peptide chain release factor N(5)-glutamine methyltransferase n=1 Tax=Enterobacteriaceae endosymbiont of Macroplea appendiculata TaxID=2675790 RepID=UPI001448E1E2|nr:peptide chain release factor N(5)-glutamine methyltransferase [Enterobacteriaceae endosymbiont of Macroplea appendiculata]QJC30728.1 peptide chain release factor N(5)-glutamine methyltransferase [Enterobacteriaceae endosymbiont of Macroplea appendiculata]